ncbi:DMT family transporter [Sporomusa acidovorans]|uniref:EamA domain-containing protein n=1 Tax=Sporomusa acidovorans (strain ATCC 49682 / DSM 3132 / Mol) TaxID=1123286 RepID=A0ABZ3J706_SPOA4|nr:EamA family transporter [Sporomusa acidovorans]OZC24301.1 putative inner membrane transporter yiJE [Sporomusa acidovorans DSM 3132]SDF02595.1 EamA domain-containing membrane protein RarD [Sporomusa acidovorans]
MNYLGQSGLSSRLQGIILLVITAVLWSTSGFGIKWIDWHPLAIAGARSAFAAVVIGIAFRRTKLCWNWILVGGGIAYAVMVISFVVASKLTTAANAILLQYTCPIFVAILGVFFLNERPSRYDWLTIVLTGTGMILFFQDQMSEGGFIGNLLAIGSGVAMAVMAVCMRQQKDGAPFGAALLGNVLTFVCGLPFMFADSPGTEGWLALLALGCVQLGLAYVLYSIAIKLVSALEASIITMIEPILNPLWVFLLIGEGPGFWALIGGGVILTAITIRYVVPALKPLNAMVQGHSNK